MLKQILGKILKKKLIKNPKDISAKDIRESRKSQNNSQEISQDIAQEPIQKEKIVKTTKKNQVPDRTNLNAVFNKLKKNIQKTSIVPISKDNNTKPEDNSIKSFIAQEFKNSNALIQKEMSKVLTNSKLLSTANIEINKDILAVNKNALDVQKESLEEQKEAEYRSEHRYKQTLKKAVQKTKDASIKGIGLAKSGVDKVKGDSGILGMVGKVLAAGYLLKKFWPLIKEKLWPFIKDKIFPYIKDNLKEVVLGLGLAKIFMDPIGSLKTLFKMGKGLLKGLGSVALKLTKFTAKGLYKLTKGTLKMAWKGLSGMAKPLFNEIKDKAINGIAKAKDLAMTGMNKVKDLATSGLAKAKDKLISFKDGMSSSIGKLTEKFSGKFKGMSEKMSDISTKVKGIGGKLIEKGIGGTMKIGKGIGGVLKVLKPLAKVVPFLGLIVTVWDLLEMFFPNFTTQIKEMFSLDKIKALGADIWEKVKDGVGAISGWISDKMAGIIDVVRDLVAGLISNTYGKLPLIGKYANKLADFVRGKKVQISDEDAKTEQKEKTKAQGIEKANKVADTLEKNGVIETNIFGKDEIKDFKTLKKYDSKVLQGFIDSDNYSEEDNKKIKSIIKEKKEQKKKKDSSLAQEQYKEIKKAKEAKFNILPKEEQKKIQNDKNTKMLVGLNKTKDFYVNQIERIKKSNSPNKDKSIIAYTGMLNKISKKIENTENNINNYNNSKNNINNINNTVLKEGKKGKETQESEILYAKDDITKVQKGTKSQMEGPLLDKTKHLQTNVQKVTLPKGSENKEGALNIDKIKDKDIFTLSGSAASGGFAKMNKAQKHNVKAMGFEYAEATGRKMSLSSAYRSVEHQKALYEKKLKKVKKEHPDWSDEQVKKETRRWVAPPGRSAHNTGLAVDIDYQGKGKKSPEVDKAISMGLFKKYNLKRPLDNEPWHIVPANLSFDEQKRMANKLATAANSDNLTEDDIKNGIFRDDDKKGEPTDESEIDYAVTGVKDESLAKGIIAPKDEVSLYDKKKENPIAQDVITDTHKEDKESSFKSLVTDMSKGLGATGNSIFKDLGLSKLVNIDKDGSINVIGNSEKKESISQNLLRKGITNNIGSGINKIKGLFGNNESQTAGEIRNIDGTGNAIKRVANDTKTRDIELKSKREKQINIDNITKQLAIKIADKKVPKENKKEKSNTTIITGGVQAPIPQMTLKNTEFNDNMLSLVGGII